jgi:hypothetical protein
MVSRKDKGKEELEEVEGLDDRSKGGWGDYPLDSVFVRREPRTVSEVLKRIENKRYVLDPDFQRDFVWDEEKQSKLIESCVMRIPLPVFYVAEAPDGRIIIVDGLQRITTFLRYVGNNFRLKGLSLEDEDVTSHPLEGKTFGELPLNLQERILDTQLVLYILDSKAPERARLDIFERVNSGVPLTRQQMRNALYNGPATTWLKQAAKSSLFRTVTGSSLRSSTMRDREVVNRFCAFMLLGWTGYRGDMDAYLAATLKKMNSMKQADLDRLWEALDRSLKSNQELFGIHALRKSFARDNPKADRNVLNISLCDVCLVLLARIPEVLTKTSRRGQEVRKALIRLVETSEFSRAITYSTNSTRAVKARFELAEGALGLSEVLP